MDVKYINPFIESTINIFKTMVGLNVGIEKPFIKKPDNPIADISGSIGMTGDLNGVISITFEKEIACKVASSFLGEHFSDLNIPVKDTVGELANMICGGAKTIISKEEMDYTLALPSVIVGTGHSFSYIPGVPCMVIPFKIKEINKYFYLEVCLKINK